MGYEYVILWKATHFLFNYKEVVRPLMMTIVLVQGNNKQSICLLAFIENNLTGMHMTKYPSPILEEICNVCKRSKLPI